MRETPMRSRYSQDHEHEELPAEPLDELPAEGVTEGKLATELTAKELQQIVCTAVDEEYDFIFVEAFPTGGFLIKLVREDT